MVAAVSDYKPLAMSCKQRYGSFSNDISMHGSKELQTFNNIVRSNPFWVYLTIHMSSVCDANWICDVM